MFSSGQIHSKEWIIQELTKVAFFTDISSIAIVGAWYGTLGIMLSKQMPSTHITMLDIDPRCEKFIKNIIYNSSTLSTVTEDMYRYNYTEDCVINTSCEHISSVNAWLDLLSKNTMVVLQSNNYVAGGGHINCVNSKDEFLNQVKLNEIIYTGELVLPMYTRYMIIGKT